jgi:peptidyl-prolyl cis-trans isomerase B (cyclophilin B)
MRTRVTLISLALLAVTACGGSSGPPVNSNEYLAFRAQPTACGAEQPPSATVMSFDAPADLKITGTVTAVIHTSCGDITLALYPQAAATAVNSFVFLAERHYFDGTVVQRVLPGFIMQMGDPTASGYGGPGYTIGDELPPADFPYQAGVVAMANDGQPDHSGSQFFIVLGTTQLPNTYSVFASVAQGDSAQASADTLNAIQRIDRQTQPNSPELSWPVETVYIESIDIRR